MRLNPELTCDVLVIGAGRIAALGSREIYFGHGAPVSDGDGVDNKFK